MKDSAFKNILVNLRTAFSTNVRKRINDNTGRIAELERTIAELDGQITRKYHYLNLMDYYARHEEEASAFSKELDYLRQFGNYDNFPYPRETQPLKVISGFDKEAKLPYVVHNGKKLYFSSDVSEEEAVWFYLKYIQNEKLLGIGDQEAPHQYQSSTIHVADGDVVFDIGAAEGLFALDQIDRASRVIIVENDSKWIAPLQHTFAPYREKVTLVQKFISSMDTDNTMSLKKLLSDMDCNSAFVKLDIEGYELPALFSAVEVLKAKKGMKIAAATYHRQHDAEEIKNLLEGMGYATEYSDGFMLFHLYDMPTPPYFRKGLIRAISL